MKHRLLLLNPPIHDFAAYNLWARPLGLLYLASFLREMGFDLDFIDCLALEHEALFLQTNPQGKPSKQRKYSTYHYFKQEKEKPEALHGMQRRYYRFGLDPESLTSALKGNIPPDLILITSMMTYWYPGVFEIIRTMRQLYGDTPVVLGGIYAQLCPEHAGRLSGADYICGSKDYSGVLQTICAILEDDSAVKRWERENRADRQLFSLRPALDLYQDNQFIPLLTAFGCPYNCKYCASSYLCPTFVPRAPDEIFQEILFWTERYGVRDIAFYDDALLFGKEQRIIPVLEKIVSSSLAFNFHAPNGIHIRLMDQGVIQLMKEAGLKTLRLSLESADQKIQRESGAKVSNPEFEQTIRRLFNAGFNRDNLGIYVLMGLPDQTVEAVAETIRYVRSFGLEPKLCEFSPIPHTPYFAEALKSAKVDFRAEPLVQNNTTLELWSPLFSTQATQELKAMAGGY